MYRFATSEACDEIKSVIKPQGYQILVAMPEPIEKIGGIFIPEDTGGRERTASIVALVLSVGPDAYKDTKKFPTGAWCKAGDYVMFRSYSGNRVSYKNREFRLVNDDTISAVVTDPTFIERAV